MHTASASQLPLVGSFYPQHKTSKGKYQRLAMPSTSAFERIEVPELGPTGFASHAIKTTPNAGLTVYTAGQIGSIEGKLVPTFIGQAKQAYDNLRVTLESSGSRVQDIVRLNMYCVRWLSVPPEVQAEFYSLTAEFLGLNDKGEPHRPTTTLLGQDSLYAPDCLFEVDAIAVLPATPSHL